MILIKKLTAIIILLIMLTTLNLPIISYAEDRTESGETSSTGESSSTGNSTTGEQTKEIGTEYEIKEEETWDISKNGDGSVIAKWTLDDKTITISGNGEMKGWTSNLREYWHNSKYTKLIEKVKIEDGITSIGYKAFSYCKSVTDITIPNGVKSIEIPSSVTSIGKYAFYRCNSLTYIKIPNSVTSIGDGAFSKCRSLTDINVGENNKYYVSIDGILYNKNKSKIICYPQGKQDLNFSIPNSVTSIGYEVFGGCSRLTNIAIPDSVTSIGNYAFEECSNLTNITIPNSVTSIGGRAFKGCSRLTNIAIPNSVTSIGYNVFCGCSSLTNIEIPNSVTSIKNGAFEECSSLTSIEIPNSVTSIGERAFKGCSNLKSITIPSSVTNIETWAFYGCRGPIICNTNSKAHEYCESNKIPYILGDSAISVVETEYEIKQEETWDISKNGDGSVIAKWTLYDRTITISGNGEMKDWLSDSNEDWHSSKYKKIIEKVIIEKGVTSIGESAFKGCSNLKSITIPSSVTNIETRAFYGCRSLTSIKIPKSVTSIGDSIFEECSSLTSINVEESNQKYISVDGVLYNKNKTEIICYPSKKKDANYTILSGVTSIKTGAFSGCSSLTRISISNGVTSIEMDTFNGCSSLTSIEIPDSVTRIKPGAFSGCSSLTNITIPNRVTSIDNLAFYECSSLESIEIPNSVTSIGDYAFKGCSSLTNITIPNSITSIESHAFRGCSSLTNITIPNSVTSIGDYAFFGCSSLTSITIPSSVTSISDSAFSNCGKLENIYVEEGNPKYTSIDGVLYNKDKTELIYYPNGKKDASFAIPSSITTIGNNAFSNYEGVIICKRNSEAHRYAESEKIGYLLMKDIDLNENNQVDIGDILLMLRHISQNNSSEVLNKHPQWKLSDRNVIYGDINKNGTIDIGDVLKVRRYMAAKASKSVSDKHPDWLNID